MKQKINKQTSVSLLVNNLSRNKNGYHYVSRGEKRLEIFIIQKLRLEIINEISLSRGTICKMVPDDGSRKLL